MINIEPVTIVLQKAGQNLKEKKIKKRKRKKERDERKNTQFQFDNC